MRKILLIKVGDTFPGLKAIQGDFEQMIYRAVDAKNLHFTLYDARLRKVEPNLTDFDAVIITGSHSMVTDLEPWSEQLLAYIREMHSQNIQVLAICYGHQLVAKAMGGEVGFHPLGPEPGTVEVTLSKAGQRDCLFAATPDTFKVNVAHSQTVTKLPKQAVLLAGNSFEPHQAMRIGNIWSLQFHPEFNAEITRYYVREIADQIRLYNGDPTAISHRCEDTADSRALLARFLNIFD